MKRQRLYWLAEITEHHAATWQSSDALYTRVAREAAESRDTISEDEFKEVLSHLLGVRRIEYKPGRGRRDLIRRAAPPTGEGV